MFHNFRELVSVEVENRTVGFRMRGFVTNANYSLKKFQFLLFINSKLLVVMCQKLV